MLDRQTSLHKILMELADQSTRLDETQADQYLLRLKGLYQKGFRHHYSGIYGVITRIDAEDQQDLEILQRNIQTIYDKSLERPSDDDDFKARLEKLYDHINLDIARITYAKEINRRQEERDKTTRIELTKLTERAQEMQRDYITILGIFASIIITFVAGIGISGSVLNNIDKVSIYRLTFIILLLALFLSNLLNILLNFIKQVRGHNELATNKSLSTIAGVNTLFLFLMLVDILLWAIYWYRATGYTVF